ncbi:MAG TPA: mesaconyl-C4 CoA hydratase [Mycobacteriales bacterium]|nr:mesaconyl-C4 CoA hydratase [Mycobacteriales bacterium]
MDELISAEPARALAGLLGVPAPGLDLPPLWHWVYLLDRPAQADLGPDGHPLRGLLVPPGPRLRRMWAGGRVHVDGSLHIGLEATRRSAVTATVPKAGRSGPLTIVTVTHEISQYGRTVVREEQDIVYRRPSGALSTSDIPAAPAGPGEWEIETSPTLLFRFSALTYNGHRIHYDRDYARTEGYPGLVVHGPLQALAMASVLRCAGTGTFTYRLLAPLFDFQGMRVSGGPDGTAAVRDRTGRQTATGRWVTPDQ